MAVTALLSRQPTLANLLIAFLDRRPGDAEGDFLLARVAAMLIVSTVESRPENIQRMRRQMVAHGWRKVFVARVRHRETNPAGLHLIFRGNLFRQAEPDLSHRFVFTLISHVPIQQNKQTY